LVSGLDATVQLGDSLGIERVLEELERLKVEQGELLAEMAENWRSDLAANREETLAAIRETANEQVPYNVRGVCVLSPIVPTKTQIVNSIWKSSASPSQTRSVCS
jgi:hypothetical protein